MRMLDEIRQELDAADRQLVACFEKRMKLCREVAAWKLANGMEVLDSSREKQVLASRREMLTDKTLENGVTELYEKLMEISRTEQEKMIAEAQQ